MEAPPMIAALYVREDSTYKAMEAVDAWDHIRDARKYPGPHPVAAHPPCRAWGQLKHMAKPREDEEDLGRHAVAMVRKWGGVLEHPARSALWADQGLPGPGQGRDAWGGWTFAAPQFWWGHRANKATWLYIVGVEPKQLPAVPLVLGEAPCVIASSSYARGRSPKQGGKSGMSKGNRERTPPEFAAWIVETVRRCKAPVDMP